MAGVLEVEVDGVEHADHGLGNHAEANQVCATDDLPLTRRIKEVELAYSEVTGVDSWLLLFSGVRLHECSS